MSVRPKWNLALDALIALAFLGTAMSGLVFFLDLAGPGSSRESWLLARDAWRSLHDWFGLAMLAGVGVHLLVHWKWIVHATLVQLGLKGRKARTAVASVGPERAVAPEPTVGVGAACLPRGEPRGLG